MKRNHSHADLIAVFVRRHVAVSMLYAALALLGAVSRLRLPVDLLPDLSYPRLTVWTVYVEAVPAEVETDVVGPVEGGSELGCRGRSELAWIVCSVTGDER